jgi:hypothetical protein
LQVVKYAAMLTYCPKVIVRISLTRSKVQILYFTPPGIYEPIPVAARSKVWDCGLSLAGVSGSNAAEGMDMGLL